MLLLKFGNLINRRDVGIEIAEFLFRLFIRKYFDTLCQVCLDSNIPDNPPHTPAPSPPALTKTHSGALVLPKAFKTYNVIVFVRRHSIPTNRFSVGNVVPALSDIGV